MPSSEQVKEPTRVPLRKQTPKKSAKSWFKLSKTILAMLFKLASSEEESVLSGATVIDYGQMKTDWTPDVNELIGPGFFSMIITEGSA